MIDIPLIKGARGMFHWLCAILVFHADTTARRGTQSDAIGILILQIAGHTIAFQGVEDRKIDLIECHEIGFDGCPFRDLSQGQNLSIRVSMLVIGGRMRVNDHYPVDIVNVGKHRNAHLIGHEQSQQK